VQQATSIQNRDPRVQSCLPEWSVGERAARRAARVLRDLAMPPEEITTILASGDARFVHRHLELHAERLEERLAAQRRQLTEIEHLLCGAGGLGLVPSPTGARPAVERLLLREAALHGGKEGPL
jgi:DNA-binding transcriptional MerR regulator